MRPEPSEYDAYYGLYIDQVPAGDIVELLAGEIHHRKVLQERYLQAAT